MNSHYPTLSSEVTELSHPALAMSQPFQRLEAGGGTTREWSACVSEGKSRTHEQRIECGVPQSTNGVQQGRLVPRTNTPGDMSRWRIVPEYLCETL